MDLPAATPHVFSLTVNKVHSHQWLLDDELSQIWPLPRQDWDRTSITAPVGDYDSTHAGAEAVYNFLNTASTQESTCATKPLWMAIDGPWRLQALQPLH